MIIFLHLVTFGGAALLGFLTGWWRTRTMRAEARQYLRGLFSRSMIIHSEQERLAAWEHYLGQARASAGESHPKLPPSASNPAGWPMKFVTTGSAGSSPPPVLWQGLEDRRESGAGDAVHGASGPPSAGPDELAEVPGDPEG